jgi:hypothetical protein
MHIAFPIVATLITAFMVIAGLRGRRVASTPHCRNCGYDLHGLADLTRGRCSECGSDFPEAVDLGERKPNGSLVKTGLVFFVVIWLGWGAFRLLDFLGPAFVRIRSNDSLSRMFFDESNYDESAASEELSRRMSNGQFGPQDASTVVDKIIARSLQHHSRQDFFSRFLADANRINAITPSQFAAIGHLVSPDLPNDTTLTIDQVNLDLYSRTSGYKLELHKHRDAFGLGFPYWQPGFQITGFLLCNSASKKVIPVKFLGKWGFSDECGIYFDPTILPAGVYDAQINVNVQINPVNITKVLTSWTQIERHCVKVWPDSPLILFSRTSPLSIDTTSPDDPSIANKISVQVEVIHAKGQLRLATKLISKGIIPGLFAQVIVRANGTDYFGGRLVVPARTAGGFETFAIAPSFPENVSDVDVVLKPEFEDARQWGDAPAIYGNPLAFQHVPMGIRQ